MLNMDEFFKNGDIINLAEEAVYLELKAFIDKKEVEFCQCDKCLCDIACVVLNNIPSMYTSSIADRTYPSQEFKAGFTQLRDAAAAEIPKAIGRVKDRLHH
ncbi:late competence development ComFB family protein [Maridesulfovibrio sp. FT414]|uniref:late competence development ComFB family protein n=1 Tax=Maridesulfovibrio sp. FT414 TaxID=2979469 RepID=UPI003D801742